MTAWRLVIAQAIAQGRIDPVPLITEMMRQ